MKWQIYILLLLVLPEAWGQGLCDNANAVKNGFKLDANAGCSPFRIEPENLMTDWTDVNYIFDYRGQAAEDLPNLNPSQQDVLFNKPDGSIATYTILQFGKDANGLERYSCQNVAVRKDNQPKFSYTVCNSNTITVSIPKDISNNFDYYILDWGEPQKERIEASQLEYSRTRNLSTPRQIKLEGFYSNGQIACPSPSFIEIPAFSNSNFPDGYDKPYHPNISKLELLEDGSAEINFTGSFNAQGYDLIMYQRGTVNINTPLNGIMPGKYAVDLPDPSKSYCFYLVGSIACGIESSAEICTIPTEEIEVGEGFNELNWTAVKKNQFLFPNQPQFGRDQSTTLELKIKDEIGTTSNISLPLNDITYKHIVDCKKQYCYQVSSKITGQLFYHKFSGESLSQKRCVDRSSFKPPSLNTLNASYNGDDSHLVSFIDDSNWGLGKEQFYLFAVVNGDTIVLDSASQVVPLKNTKKDIECYSIAYKDECGSVSELSPTVCVVNLNLENDEQLVWSSTNPFSMESILNYEIYALNENTNTFEYLADRSNAFNELKPDLSTFIEEAIFKVKVVGSNGSVSWSNSKFIPLDFKLFLPDAFSPNGDGENDVLELKGSLGRADSMSFEVFDRWGKLIFASDSQNLKWDATLKDKTIPMGQYVYRFNAQLKDGSSYQQNGFIQILK